MAERHRALPSWMEKKEKVTEKEPLKSRRKRRTVRGVFYCMNEKELVEAAVSFLTKEDEALPADLKVEDKAAATTVKMRENPSTSRKRAKLVTLEEESSDCDDALETTYVSETDVDITEVETVAYTNSPQHQGPKGQRSGPEQGNGGLVNIGLGAEEKEEHSQTPVKAAEEDDALRLVREIFFT
ncbi:uncharacterized protein si:ch211-127m7.2 [Anoplopoma fimbria]|uniref:uncharacterized protein si:ch211-127m7.2 n=1 Tax=Anoplopoma fimbria TaxID=229290 RepID=UPI0023EB6B79|nr:uncharacterized protein si:ch211-127m7.2 [Anoplopoma fimbria]